MAAPTGAQWTVTQAEDMLERVFVNVLTQKVDSPIRAAFERAGVENFIDFLSLRLPDIEKLDYFDKPPTNRF